MPTIVPDPPDSSQQARRPLTIEPVALVSHYVLTLTVTQANDLYNEVYRLDRDRCALRADFPTIFDFYDALFGAGVDGSGGYVPDSPPTTGEGK